MATRINFPERIEARKASAKVRQEAYDKLTTTQKLGRAKPGSKEHHKLTMRGLTEAIQATSVVKPKK